MTGLGAFFRGFAARGVISGAALAAGFAGAAAGELPLDLIRLPPGFTIEIYADDLPGARSMARGSGGTLFVGTRSLDRVYAVRDLDGDRKADETRVLLEHLRSPNGVALREGALYVAEIGRLLRYDDIEARLDDPPPPVVVSDAFPKNGHHGWKFIRFGPDGRLYVPVGAPCNICESVEPYASILRLWPDGSELEIYVRGVRNSVGFDWHPGTGELWFTDNGRDGLGDDLPPDELNRVAAAGQHFGYPYCHGGFHPDPKFGAGHDCGDYALPAVRLGPHVAALGMRFYTGAMFPAPYRDQVFIAEHGSWDRSEKIGYRVSLVSLEGNRAVSYETFAEGWLQGDEAWGRPVDLLVMPDGALLVSDDEAGAIYRISYSAGSSDSRSP